MKKVLIVASVASMIDQFNRDNIKLLKSLGYAVDVATNFDCPGTITKERSEELVQLLDAWEVDCYQVDFDRNVFDVKSDLRAYSQLNQIFNSDKDPMNRRHHDKGQYTFVHCHSPIGGALGRLVAKKNGVKTIYTAHGFHFYDGAPFKNWLIFYPVEKWLSRWTDILITITKEDYNRALKHFKAKRVEYIPGVGVDTKKFAPDLDGRKRIRKELGVDDSRIVLLSVGELNDNKNHISVVDAIKGMDLTYVIVGQGKNYDMLLRRAQELNVDLRLMGYRRDVSDFYNAADVYILPSIREGLNVSLMEAMASGLPCVCSDIRGNDDLIDQGKGGRRVTALSTDDWSDAIKDCLSNNSYGDYNRNKIVKFSIKEVETKSKGIYYL